MGEGQCVERISLDGCPQAAGPRGRTLFPLADGKGSAAGMSQTKKVFRFVFLAWLLQNRHYQIGLGLSFFFFLFLFF